MNEYERWESRFAAPEYVFGTAPNVFLAAHRHLLPKRGRALAIADGEGRSGVWLAEQGLDVFAFDFSPTAQSKAQALAASRGVNITTVLTDVAGYDWPADAFDVVIDIFTQISDPAERAQNSPASAARSSWAACSCSRAIGPSRSPTALAAPKSRRICTPARCWNGSLPRSRASRSRSKTSRCTKAPRMPACQR
jgi:hypothetical protein